MQTNYASILPALRDLGIHPDDVAAAAVFTTGDPTERLVRQAQALDRAISMIDLTTLEGADTAGKVRAMCAKARQPDPDQVSIHRARGGAVDASDQIGPASADPRQDPRAAVPSLWLKSGDNEWVARRDLLDSGPEDRHFVIEFDDRGEPWLRFGDGRCGMRPAPDTEFAVSYRFGSSATGNVGAEAITGFIGDRAGSIRHVRNPLPAAGGTDPEPTAVVKRLAPTAYKSELLRAVAASAIVARARAVPGVAAVEVRVLSRSADSTGDAGGLLQVGELEVPRLAGKVNLEEMQ